MELLLELLLGLLLELLLVLLLLLLRYAPYHVDIRRALAHWRVRE